MNAAHPGGLGGTYAGNPLAVAAANAVLDVINNEALRERAVEIGRRAVTRLRSVAERQGMERIGDVRGLGAMIAFELVDDRETKAASPSLTSRIVAEAERRGLILLSCGTRQNVIRLLPPLTIEYEILEEGLDIIEESIEAAIASEAASVA
jgi:4-aminobutyrate aminotransferase/(S)-3-amino-2-methylpropionate transaminase